MASPHPSTATHSRLGGVETMTTDPAGGGSFVPPPYVMCVCDELVPKDQLLTHLRTVHLPFQQMLRANAEAAEAERREQMRPLLDWATAKVEAELNEQFPAGLTARFDRTQRDQSPDSSG